jgi:hypothetical protein
MAGKPAGKIKLTRGLDKIAIRDDPCSFEAGQGFSMVYK